MTTSFPGSLDSLSNPTAGSFTPNPSHIDQHATANDAIEQLELKLGTGASVPTTAGHVLRATGAGASAFGALVDGDIPAAIARDAEVTSAVSTHAALSNPHSGAQPLDSDLTAIAALTTTAFGRGLLALADAAALSAAHVHNKLRFVPVARELVFNAATTAANVPIGLSPAIAILPADAVLATGYLIVGSDAAANNSNHFILHHANVAADIAAIAYDAVAAGLNVSLPFTCTVIHSSGRKLYYTVSRGAGTITYSLAVTGYWTAAA